MKTAGCAGTPTAPRRDSCRPHFTDVSVRRGSSWSVSGQRTSGSGYRPRPLRLLDQELHLDPDIQRMAQELEAQMAARQIVGLWLRPNWSTLLPAWQTIMSQPLQRPAGPMFTPGAGPATPRPGDFSDVTGAVYQLPAVQHLAQQAHDEGLRRPEKSKVTQPMPPMEVGMTKRKNLTFAKISLDFYQPPSYSGWHESRSSKHRP